MNIENHYDGSRKITVMNGAEAEMARRMGMLAQQAALDPNVKSIEQVKNIGPNDICPCGSGKKFKKCHQYAGVTIQ